MARVTMRMQLASAVFALVIACVQPAVAQTPAAQVSIGAGFALPIDLNIGRMDEITGSSMAPAFWAELSLAPTSRVTLHTSVELPRAYDTQWRHPGTAGPPWWYVADMPRYFGELIYVPIAIAVWTVLRNRSSNGMRAVLLWAAVPYAVFSVCATKAPGYVMVAAPAVFLLQADAWLWLWRKRHVEVRLVKRVPLTVLLVLLAVLPARQLLEPTGALENRERNPKWVRDLRRLNERIGAEKAVVFNVRSNIEAMFYTPYIVYPQLPSVAEARTLQQYGYRVYVLDDGSAPTELPLGVRAIRPE